MSEQPEHTQAVFDEPLAAFTDLLLNGPAHAGSTALIAEDEDLRRLQQMVSRLHTAFGPAHPPDPAMAGRIRQNVQAALPQSQPAAQPSLGTRLRSLLAPERKGWRSGRQSQRAQILRYSLATVAVLVLLLIIVPSTGTLLTGTALGEGGILPYAFLGILIVIVAIWFWRSKPK